MTGLDIFFVVMLGVDILAIGAMGFAAASMVETAKRGQGRLQPAMREVKALADTGKQIAEHAKTDGQAAVGRVKGVAAKIKQRLETTKRIVTEMKPAGEETAETLGDAADELQATRRQVIRTTQTLADMARRVGRVKNAAEAARDAGRR